MKTESIPYQHIATEIGVECIDAAARPCVVYNPKAKTNCELLVAPTDPAHPLFYEYAIQERVFRVMKDYRFFQLCLPAVFGMGCVDGQWDWVLRKQYLGAQYGQALSTKCPWPLQLAREMAMIIFDLSQVPVLKFKKDIEATNYPEALEQFQEQCAHIDLSEQDRAMLNSYVSEMSAFFAQNIPTLYCITNGALYPESLTHLPESIVVRNWEGARIVALEHIIADLVYHALPHTEWIAALMNEVSMLCDVQPEWMKQMMRFVFVRNVSQGKVAAKDFSSRSLEIAMY